MLTPEGPARGEPSPWNLPNTLTVMRILLVPIFLWLLLREGGEDAASRWWAWAALRWRLDMGRMAAGPRMGMRAAWVHR